MVTLRGEVCIGSASALSFAAMLLLIFVHIGQINTSAIPQAISMVNLNTTGFSAGLEAATGDPKPGLYNVNLSRPLAANNGLRYHYQWGLYNYCAYTGEALLGVCSNSTTAFTFTPFEVIMGDTPVNYSVQVVNVISTDLYFRNSSYLGTFTRAAYYLLLLGSISAAIAFLCGLYKSTGTFLVATILAMFGAACLLITSAIWTAIAIRAQDINSVQYARLRVSPTQGAPLGLIVTFGTGIWLLWAAYVALFLSTLPYLVSCCTFRR